MVFSTHLLNNRVHLKSLSMEQAPEKKILTFLANYDSEIPRNSTGESDDGSLVAALTIKTDVVNMTAERRV